MGENAHSPRPQRPTRGRPASPGSAVLTPPTGVPAVPDVPGQRRPDDTRPPVARPVVVEPCACGHARAAHDHYRRGNDCGACGAEACAEYRREGGAVRQTLRRWGLLA